jgi:hypothetical protein
MYTAELECQVLNLDKPPKYVEILIKEVEGGLVLKNTVEARVYISKLTTMLKD